MRFITKEIARIVSLLITPRPMARIRIIADTFCQRRKLSRENNFLVELPIAKKDPLTNRIIVAAQIAVNKYITALY